MGVFFEWKSVTLSLGGSNPNLWLWPCQWCSGQSEWQLHHPWTTHPSWFCWVHGTRSGGRLGRRVVQVRQKMWSVESWNHTVSITDVIIIRVQNRKLQSLHPHLHQCYKIDDWGVFYVVLQVHHALWIPAFLRSVWRGLWVGEGRAMPGLSGQPLHQNPGGHLWLSW